MRIEITGTTGIPYVLAFGDTRACVASFSISNRRKADVREGIRAARAIPTDRKNGITSLSVSVNRLHDSVSDAVLFALDHDRNVPLSGTVKIFISKTLGQPGGAARVLTNAVIEVGETSYQGATTVTNYQIIGSEMVKAAS